MVEYGPVPSDRAAEYRDVVNYAFWLGEGPLGTADDLDAHLYPDLGDRRAVFDEDALRCVCRQYTLSTRIRGDRHALGGITVGCSASNSWISSTIRSLPGTTRGSRSSGEPGRRGANEPTLIRMFVSTCRLFRNCTSGRVSRHPFFRFAMSRETAKQCSDRHR